MKHNKIFVVVAIALTFVVNNKVWGKGSEEELETPSQIFYYENSIYFTQSEKIDLHPLFENAKQNDFFQEEPQWDPLFAPPGGGGDPQKILPVKDNIWMLVIFLLVYGISRNLRIRTDKVCN